MASKTTNYELNKIDLADSPPDITVLNTNADIIDTQLKKNADDISKTNLNCANADDFNNLKTEVNSTIENLDTTYQTINDTTLKTSNKTITGAINEVFQSANDGKGSVATAIKNKDVTATVSETFASLAGKIDIYLTKKFGTAATPNVLSGKTFKNSTGEELTGTMPDRSGYTSTSSYTEGTFKSGTTNYIFTGPSVTGYYNTSSYIRTPVTNLSAANIKSGVAVGGIAGTFTNDATATSSDIISGKTAYVNGAKLTGTGTSVTITTAIPAQIHVGGWTRGGYYTTPELYFSLNSIPGLSTGKVVVVPTSFTITGGNCMINGNTSPTLPYTYSIGASYIIGTTYKLGTPYYFNYTSYGSAYGMCLTIPIYGGNYDQFYSNSTNVTATFNVYTLNI